MNIVCLLQSEKCVFIKYSSKKEYRKEIKSVKIIKRKLPQKKSSREKNQ